MAKCSMCGTETQAFKIYEGGEWNWYCGNCYHQIKKEAKEKKMDVPQDKEFDDDDLTEGVFD